VMSTKAGSRSGGRRSRLLVRRIALPPVGASHLLWANAQCERDKSWCHAVGSARPNVFKCGQF
jgi:hypothetical protein